MKIAILATGTCATIAWLAFAGAVCGSGEGGVGVRFESVVLDASEAGYRFSMKMDAKETLELIEVEWSGKKFSFGRKDFGLIERVFIQGVKISAPTPYSTGKQDQVIIVLPYNVKSVRIDGDKPLRDRFDVIRLHFDNGKLSMWEKAESIEKKPGEWKLTSKGEIASDVVDGVDRVDSNGVHDNGKASGDENPYARIRIYEDSH